MYGYQRIVKIYKRFKRYFDFLGAKATIIIVVKDCEVYIRIKVLRYKLYKEFQILSMFERTWSSVTIDFIVKLFKSRDPVSNTNYNSIFVIVKRLIKYNNFIFINESYSIKDFINIVIWEVINNYGLLNEFVIDRDTTFTLRFFITFIIKLGVNNKLFITFYP